MAKNDHTIDDINDILDYVELHLDPEDKYMFGAEAVSQARQAADGIYEENNPQQLYYEFINSMIETLNKSIKHCQDFEGIVYHKSITQSREFERAVFIKIKELMDEDEVPEIDWDKVKTAE